MSLSGKDHLVVNVMSRIPGVEWSKLSAEELAIVWDAVRDLPVVGPEARDHVVEAYAASRDGAVPVRTRDGFGRKR